MRCVSGGSCFAFRNKYGGDCIFLTINLEWDSSSEIYIDKLNEEISSKTIEEFEQSIMEYKPCMFSFRGFKGFETIEISISHSGTKEGIVQLKVNYPTRVGTNSAIGQQDIRDAILEFCEYVKEEIKYPSNY